MAGTADIRRRRRRAGIDRIRKSLLFGRFGVFVSLRCPRNELSRPLAECGETDKMKLEEGGSYTDGPFRVPLKPGRLFGDFSSAS